MNRVAVLAALAVIGCGQPDAAIRAVLEATVPPGMPQPTPVTTRGTNTIESSWGFELQENWSSYRADVIRRLSHYALRSESLTELVLSRAVEADAFRLTIRLEQRTVRAYFVASPF